MNDEIEKAIHETLVIENKQSIGIAVKKIMQLIEPTTEKPSALPSDARILGWCKEQRFPFKSQSLAFQSGANMMRSKAEPIIATQQSEIERLKEQLERYEGDSIHSCHPNCKRPMCVLRQEIASLKSELEQLKEWEGMEAVKFAEWIFENAFTNRPLSAYTLYHDFYQSQKQPNPNGHE